MKMQPWVHPDTERAIRVHGLREKLTPGEVLDEWFRERAGLPAKAAPALTRRFSEQQQPEEEFPILDEEGNPIL